ncbi:MAG: ABC transporter permease subunit [Candidatus Pseudobacter hemicellulosilyticus]|uniref:ABC transporter permease subunit n=1 Tax=Candidatus Pseudobacter hemicellulosilyticus TaxID=3121375 RepID=A0AAJ5WQI8_9BACT|nr:MAG: ABC transporter permease subunit [Pseudobacter sp.]
MFTLARHILYDILRSKVVIGYTLFLLAASLSLFQLEENSGKSMLSLLNIVLIVTPLISMVFATIHYYNSYEFIELMLSQPLSRTHILLSEYIGVAISLLAAFWIGIGIPVLLFAADATGLSLLMAGSALTLAFSSLAFLAAVRSRDKARGIGAVLLLWFYFALLYDGLVLLILFSFADYPMEKFTLLLAALNPLDLARISLMLQMDISALMGYTGAVYQSFFGSALGTLFTSAILLLWIAVPLWLAVRVFRKKDL